MPPVLSFAPEHAPDDEQAWRWPWPRRSARSGRWSPSGSTRRAIWLSVGLRGTTAASMQVQRLCCTWDILARCAKARVWDRRRPLLRTTGRPMPRSPSAPGTIWPWPAISLNAGRRPPQRRTSRSPMPPEESRAEYRVLQARLVSASGRYAEAMTALRQAERTGPLPKLLERELLQAMELAARELQDYKTAYECAARQLAVMRGSTFSLRFWQLLYTENRRNRQKGSGWMKRAGTLLIAAVLLLTLCACKRETRSPCSPRNLPWRAGQRLWRRLAADRRGLQRPDLSHAERRRRGRFLRGR